LLQIVWRLRDPEVIVELDKQQVLDMLKTIGQSESIPDAARSLPDKVDLDRDGEQLFSYGLTRDHLVDRFGGSP
jgi:hypothetical protein